MQKVSEAFYVSANMFEGISEPTRYFRDSLINIFGRIDAAKAPMCSFLFMLSILIFFESKKDTIKAIFTNNKIIRWAAYLAIGIIIVLSSPKGVVTEFVYFQF